MLTVYLLVSFCVGFVFGSSVDSQAYVAKMDARKTLTLEQDTSVLPAEWWNANFVKAAKYYCENYTVMEKSFTPTTLSPAETKKNYYYWVIQCR